MAKTLILFLDESGSDNLKAIDPNYPILGLGGPIFEMENYSALQNEKIEYFKRRVFGSDKIILRMHDIIKRKPPFDCLNDPLKYQEFILGFNELVVNLDFSFISYLIDLKAHQAKYVDPFAPYELILGFIMESFAKILMRTTSTGIICVERRGKVPDGLLRQAYKAIQVNGSGYVFGVDMQKHIPYKLQFLDKRKNSSGLQIADMSIGIATATVLSGHFQRRDFQLLKTKFDSWHGLKRFPPPPNWKLPWPP